jgi:hypothetical protein
MESARTPGRSGVVTDQQAEQLANVVLTVAAVGAAYYIVKTPRLRRIAWGLMTTTLRSRIPAWVKQEVQHAWSEAGRSRV